MVGDKEASAAASGTQPEPKKRRQLGRRLIEEQVERAIQAHFAGLTEQELNIKQVDNLTLRQKITKDLENKETGQRLGQKYWKELKNKWKQDGTGPASLKVLDPTEPLGEVFLSALAEATSPNPTQRKYEPLFNCIQQSKGFNQRELQGLIKVICPGGPLPKATSMALVLELGRYFTRVGQVETFKKEVLAIKGHVDEALLNQYGKLRKAGVSNITFITTFKALLALVMDAGSLDKFLATDSGQWTAIAKTIMELKASSRIGGSLFSFASTVIQACNFELDIKQVVAVFQDKQETLLLKDAEATWTKLQAIMARCRESGALPGKRQVSFPLVGHWVNILIPDPTMELQLRMASAIRARSLGLHSGLPWLFFEEWIFDRREGSCTVERALLTEQLKARQLAKEMLQSEDLSCMEDVKRTLHAHAEELLSLDKGFRLELTFIMEHAETALTSSIEKQLLEFLPTQTRHTSIMEVKIMVQNLQQSKMVSFSSKACQATVKTLLELLTMLDRNLAPKVEDLNKGGQFWQVVVQRLPNFLVQDGLQGLACLKTILEEARNFMAEGALKLHHLDKLQVWRYLLNSQEQQEVDNMTAGVLKQDQSGAVASSSHGSKKAQQPNSTLMSLFG